MGIGRFGLFSGGGVGWGRALLKYKMFTSLGESTSTVNVGYAEQDMDKLCLTKTYVKCRNRNNSWVFTSGHKHAKVKFSTR